MPRSDSQPDNQIPGLYAIADAARLGARPADFVASVRALVDGGVRLLQLRLKPQPDRDDAWRFRVVERTLDALDESRGDRHAVQMWIDDRADLAACFAGSVAGVHLGQRDLPPWAVRAVLGDRPRIGLSCHGVEQVQAADADPHVDWVAIGPVFATSSKVNPDPVVGVDGVRAARVATSKPLVAIGGLGAERIPEVLAAGADSAVVLGALAAAGRDPLSLRRTARHLVRVADEARSST